MGEGRTMSMNERVRHLVEILLKEIHCFWTTVLLDMLDLTLVCLDESAVSATRKETKNFQFHIKKSRWTNLLERGKVLSVSRETNEQSSQSSYYVLFSTS
jgi:hypothetical protein